MEVRLNLGKDWKNIGGCSLEEMAFADLGFFFLTDLAVVESLNSLPSFQIESSL